MRAVETVSTFLSDGRRSRMRVKTNQTLVPFITLLLCVSSGFGENQYPDCKVEYYGICSSACDYVRNVCGGDSKCFLNLSAYLHRQDNDQLRFLHRCKDLALECAEPFLTGETKSESKRGILNKNLAYLLLKLNPFFNQTSQFGFLTSGRIRRITGNFGTEFLGKRSNKAGGKSRSGGSGDGNQPKVRPTTTPRFYSLPLNKFAQAKVLKRDYEYPEDVKDTRGKRTYVRGGHGGVILGSEFLGKRGSREFEMVPPGGSDGTMRLYNEWDDGVERKRGGELPIGDDLILGSELLGKKNYRYDLGEFLAKKLERSRVGKRTENELSGKTGQEFNNLYERIWSRYGPGVVGEGPGQEPNLRDLSLCKQTNYAFEFCRVLKPEGDAKSN